MPLATILTELMGAAVFEHFPSSASSLARTASAEASSSSTMDFEYKDQYQNLKLKKLPSERRHNQYRAIF